MALEETESTTRAQQVNFTLWNKHSWAHHVIRWECTPTIQHWVGRANKRLKSRSSEVTHSLYEKCFICSSIVCCLASSAINSISPELSKYMHWIFESLYFPVFPIIWFRGFRNQGIELGCFFSPFRKMHCIEVCITIFLICYTSQLWHQYGWSLFLFVCFW